MGAVFDHKAWRHTGNTYGSLSVGDITQLNVNGVAKNFIVVHQGNPDSALYDESCDGTWLLAKDITDYRAWHPSAASAVNSYGAASLHAFLNGTFLSRFDADVQSAIVQAKIPYVNGTGDAGNVVSGANGLSAEVFLLSGYEVGFTTSNNQSFPVDGAKLDYFESGSGATVLAKRIAEFNGSNSTWWLRSPYKGNSTNAWQVQGSGQYGSRRVTTLGGVRPCFIMPSNQKIFS